MVNRTVSLALAISISSVYLAQAAHTSSIWVGGCCNGYWNNPNNWSPKIVPDNNGVNTFDVTIGANDNYVDVILVQDRTINRLNCYSADEYDIDLGGNGITLTLTSPDGLTNHGNLGIADLGIVAVDIDGNVRNYGSLDFDGHIYIAGDLLNFEDADLEISAGETFAEYGRLENAGTLMIGFPSKFSVEPNYVNSRHIQMNGGEFGAETLLNRSTGTISGFGILEIEQLLNTGRISAAGGSLSVQVDNPMTNTGILSNKPMAALNIMYAGQSGDINNSGEIEANTGGGVAFYCNLVNQPNGVIQLLGGTLASPAITQTTNAHFQGFGAIAGNVMIDPNALIKLTGPTSIAGGIDIAADSTLEISDGTTLITGHTTCNGTIHLKGGRIIPQGGLSGDCDIIWEPGLYTNIADFNLDGRVAFDDFAYFADTWLWQTAWH